MTEGWITSRQIEAARRVLTRYVQRGGKIWIRVFPIRPVTKKGNEVPMGGGKGSPDHYVAIIKPGTVIFEMGGLTRESAKAAMDLAGTNSVCALNLLKRPNLILWLQLKTIKDHSD